MHCYIKQIIQTLCVNDHLCVFLTNQQADEESNRLSTVLPDLETTRQEKFAPPKKKAIVQMRKKQTNVHIV